LILEKVHGWTIGRVDASLQTMSRQFEVSRESVYDFIMNEICDKFNCYAVFDTYENTINFYAEALTNKFIGDGKTKSFTVSPIFYEIDSVSVDGYKTTGYTYNSSTGLLTLDSAPLSGEIIEVVDGSLTGWETDVFVTFDNLAQQMNISYSADDIKTVLTVKGADELDIREVNSGLPYIVDLSYFHTVDWMGQKLYNKYNEYVAKCTSSQAEYKTNSQEIIKLSNKIWYENNRVSLGYARASVSPDTVGSYYVQGGDADTGYYYTEVSLPKDYIVDTTYYSVNTANLDEEKFAKLYEALKTYYHTGEVTGFDDNLIENFEFTKASHPNGYTLESVKETLLSDESDSVKDQRVTNFLVQIWEQLGLTPLKTLYLAPYKEVQTTNVSAGLAEKDNKDYGLYYPVVLVINSLNTAIKARQTSIDELTKSKDALSKANVDIGNLLLLEKNFSKQEMTTLSAFLREDEYTDDTFVATGNETTEELFKLKQQLKECGHIELSKLCEPSLKFSMSLGNIYALPEFEPIVNQFQLGKLIKVALRPDYIKNTRLMQVDLNFEDFSDFSCEFGDLMSIRSQTDLHADLLSQAVSAGKTVASNASYWDKGTDTATSIDLKVQQGLLNAATEIKSIDGTQGVLIDNYGIHLQKINPETGEVDPEQGWIVNNKFLYSDDAFTTTKSVFGEFNIPVGTNENGETVYETRWGLLADAVVAGYIEGSQIVGSQIVGGTIQIGERADGSYNFKVDEDGYITMVGGKGMSSSGETIDLDDYNTTVEIEASGATLNSSTQSITLTCKIYSYGVDVTGDHDRSVFHWTRSSGDAEADQDWNASHYNNTSNNVLTVTINDVEDVAFFQCEVHLSSIKHTDSIAITLDNTDMHVFTSKPDAVQTNGYCYNSGDLWVVGDDYQPYIYKNSRPEGLKYEWYYKNVESSSFLLTNAFTENTYEVPMTEARAGRQIYCVVTDSSGNSITSKTITLNMIKQEGKLKINRNITDQEAANGENVAVTFDVEGENLTYAWYYKDSGMSAFVKTDTFTNNYYGVIMNSNRAGRQIYCVVSDAEGNSVTSNTITLSMTGKENTKWYIKSNVSDQEVAEGEYVTVVFDVLSEDFKYPQNTILVSINSNTSYSDSDWDESVYYSATFNDLNERTEKLEQHVIIDTDGLHLRASSQDDITFESLLTSEELSFGTWSNNEHNKVVWLGRDEMNARNVTVENYVNIKAVDDNTPYFTLGNFKFQVEDNGSLSIV